MRLANCGVSVHERTRVLTFGRETDRIVEHERKGREGERERKIIVPCRVIRRDPVDKRIRSAEVTAYVDRIRAYANYASRCHGLT